MKVLTACLYSSGRISTLSTSFVSGVSACAKEKIAFAACAGHLIEIVRLSEAEGSSRNVVTCSRECRLKYLSQNHKGLKMSAATREKMAESRKKVPNSAEIQRMATEAAKKSPKSGRFITNKAAIDWHLVSPEGEHFHIHSLAFWLRENHEMFGVEPDTREFKNVISGLSRVKRAMLGKIGDGQRPCATYKGWSVIPTDYDLEKLNSKRLCL